MKSPFNLFDKHIIVIVIIVSILCLLKVLLCTHISNEKAEFLYCEGSLSSLTMPKRSTMVKILSLLRLMKMKSNAENFNQIILLLKVLFCLKFMHNFICKCHHCSDNNNSLMHTPHSYHEHENVLFPSFSLNELMKQTYIKF